MTEYLDDGCVVVGKNTCVYGKGNLAAFLKNATKHFSVDRFSIWELELSKKAASGETLMIF